jgi:hypothetical protein
MPEELEVDTDKVRESIHEKPEGTLLRNIALTTALFAALGAIAALQAGGTVNEALVLKEEAAVLQGDASDQWAYYQAKGIKGGVQEAARTAWLAAGKTPPEQYEQEAKRYANEQKDIADEAHKYEHERDAKSAEADRLLALHHRFANAVALIQVSIALSAVAALTRQRWIWVGSAAIGLGGAVLFGLTMIR